MRFFAGILLFLALGAPGIGYAGTAKEYAYVFVQGRIADPYEQSALGGATIRLTEGTRVFEAVTDRNGVFVFERLPLATFTLDIVTADGKRVSWFRDADKADPSRPRVTVKFGKKRGASKLTVAPRENAEYVEVVVESPPVRWGRFWKQFAIFAAAATVLAL